MKEKGFTLIETLIAMLILSGALLTLSNTWSSSAYAISKAKRLSTIAMLLKSKITEYEIEYKDLNFSEIEKLKEGTFENYPEYSWKVEVETFPAPDFAGMMTEESGKEEMLLTVMKKMTEILEKHVKEMRVSIIWKTGKKDFVYSATTLLMDYKTPVNLGI